MLNADIIRYSCVSSYRYNSTEHPIAFHKALDLGKAPKKLAGGPAPDLEEAYEVRPIIALFNDINHVVTCCGRLMITGKTCLRMRKRRTRTISAVISSFSQPRRKSRRMRGIRQRPKLRNDQSCWRFGYATNTKSFRRRQLRHFASYIISSVISFLFERHTKAVSNKPCVQFIMRRPAPQTLSAIFLSKLPSLPRKFKPSGARPVVQCCVYNLLW